MRFSMKFAGGFLGLAAAVLLAAPGPAQAAPAVGVDEVVRALGLASEPADYVVLVDTSGSMNQGGRYPAVRSELRRLLKGLDPADRVSLLTFDSDVQRRYRGEVGSDPDAILAQLPASALGDHTDIGAAIAGGIGELERQDTRRLTALILITDGELDTVAGARYADVDSSAWRKLKTRATKLGAGHEVAAYAVSLLETTDAGLLKKIFPQASEVGSADVGDRFAAVSGDLALLQAAKALEEELKAPISVGWTGDLGAALASNSPAEVQLVITSPYPHVPVTLSDLKLKATDGVQVAVTGLPETLTLDPGESAKLTAEVRVTGTPEGDGSVSLVAKVGSPWGKVIKRDLGLTFAPTIQGTAPVPAAPNPPQPFLLPLLAGGAALLVAAAVMLLAARALLTPPMTGVLTFRRDGRDIAEIVLRGRSQRLTAPVGGAELAGLSGSVTGARATGRRPAVRLDARYGSSRARGLVIEGASTQLGEISITFTSTRLRILDKIGLPRPEVAAT